MPSSRVSRALRITALLGCTGVLGGCAAVTIAGAAAGAVVSVGGAVVGSTVKVAGKVVEKTIDLAVPSSTPEPQK